MALTCTSVTAQADTTNTTTYTSASVTPPASKPVIVAIFGSGGANPSNVPTLDTPTWLDGSWTEVSTAVAGNQRITVFRGLVVGSPSGDTLQFTFDATHNTACWSIVSVDGATGTMADLVVQAVTGSASSVTAMSITLAALGSANNANLAFFVHDVNEAHAPSGSETELSDVGVASPGRDLSTQWEINDTVSGVTWSTSTAARGIALELKAAAGGASVTGAFDFPITMDIAIAGKKGGKGAYDFPITVGITATGKKGGKGAFDDPITVTTDTAGKKGGKGAFDDPINFDIFTDGFNPAVGVVRKLLALMGIGR